jgi:hypothetical protein
MSDGNSYRTLPGRTLLTLEQKKTDKRHDGITYMKPRDKTRVLEVIRPSEPYPILLI